MRQVLPGTLLTVGAALAAVFSASRMAAADDAVPRGSAVGRAASPQAPNASPKLAASATSESLLRYSEARTYQAQFAVTVRASRVPVRNVIATCPVPVEWPEQQVRLVRENKPAFAAVKVTELPGLGAMLIVRVPALPAGGSVTVERVYEITRSKVECTLDPAGLTVPEHLDRDVRQHLKAAPDVDDRSRQIAKLAESLRKPGEAGGATARRCFDWVRQNIRFQQGEFRGARAALDTQAGDCEDMTALYVALCRASGIPARDVWVEGHAYPEFYLADAEGRAGWIPAQVAGPEWFGTMADYQPLLQKGDRARDPIRRRDGRYIAQSARAVGGPVELSVTRNLLNEPQAGRTTP